MAAALTEAERYPWLRFNHHCGDRLDLAALARVRAFALELQAAPVGWEPGREPPWLSAFAARCFEQVPFYRALGALPPRFADIPTSSRTDLSRAPWAFVPDDLALDDLIVYNTSGTTGHPLDILSHPETASKYLPLLRAALATRGVTLAGGPGVAIMLVCWQRRTITYASVSAYLDGAAFAKVNLSPDDTSTAPRLPRSI
jgi:phenylacetate-CoA ligase